MKDQIFKDNNNTNLLDILVVLAEYWKLLVFGPLIAGVLASLLIYAWPKRYESVAIVRLSESDVGLLTVGAVQNSLIEKSNLLVEFSGSQENARQYLSKNLLTKFNKKTGLSEIIATANTPEHAQKLSNAAVSTLMDEIIPKGENKIRIEKKIQFNESIISSMGDTLKQLQRKVGNAGQDVTSLNPKYYLLLLAEMDRRVSENLELRKKIMIDSESLYVQYPSVPHHAVSINLIRVVSSVFIATELILLFFVFILRAWARAAYGTESAAKMAAIKKALVW